MIPQSHIARAVNELLTEEAHLVARLEKVRAAIAAVRDALHLPAGRTPGKTVGRQASALAEAADGAPGRNGHVSVSDETILTALRKGPLSPGVLASQLGIDRARLRYRLKSLEQAGIVASEGVTASRRVALAGTHPAKEAP